MDGKLAEMFVTFGGEISFSLNDTSPEKNSTTRESRNSSISIYFILIPYILISTSGTIGNSIFCVIMWRSKRMQSAANVFMQHLCIANILFITVSTPMFLSRYVFRNEWKHDELLCKFSSSIVYVTVTAAFLLMTAVAIDRHRSIFSVTRRMQAATTYALVAIIWLVSICVAAPYFLFYEAKPQKSMNLETGEFVDEIRCRLQFPEPAAELRKLSTLIAIGIQYVIPLCINVPCYGHVCYLLWRKHMQLNSRQSQLQRGRLLKRERQKLRTIIMLISILLIFVAGWSPLFISQIISELNITTKFISVHTFLVCHLLGALSVAISPYLYLMSDTFRHEFNAVLCCCWSKSALSQRPNGTFHSVVSEQSNGAPTPQTSIRSSLNSSSRKSSASSVVRLFTKRRSRQHSEQSNRKSLPLSDIQEQEADTKNQDEHLILC